jgi:hypothetical protein
MGDGHSGRRGIAFLLVCLLLIGLVLMVPFAGANRSGMSFAQLKAPPAPAPLLPGQAAATYPVGFYGLNFNVNDDNALDLDLGAARLVNAEVTVNPTRVEVYQHSSPEVWITFYGKNFEYRDGRLVGNVTKADFRTSPLTGNISDGDVSGSTQVSLLALSGRANFLNLIDANVTSDVAERFAQEAAARNLNYTGTAFTFNITKENLDRTGAANLTFTVPSAWVSAHGGPDEIYFVRMSEADNTTRFVDASYLGEDPAGSMKYLVVSPNGTSVFGLISAKVQVAHGKDPAAGQIGTDAGMIAAVPGIISEGTFLIGAGAVVLIGIAFYGRSRLKNNK